MINSGSHVRVRRPVCQQTCCLSEGRGRPPWAVTPPTRGLWQISPFLKNLPGDTSHPAITHETRRCLLKCQHLGTQQIRTPQLGWPIILLRGPETVSGSLRLSHPNCLLKGTQTQTTARRPSEQTNAYNLGQPALSKCTVHSFNARKMD